MLNHGGSVELAECGCNDLAVGCSQVCRNIETTIESLLFDIPLIPTFMC